MNQTSSTIITNARLVNEGTQTEGEILIKNGRIEAIGRSVPRSANAEVVDVQGRYILPGMIDDQVHFREPGLTQKGSISSESRAAVAGGITSYMEMPNVKPSTTNYEALEAKFKRAEGRSSANFSFYFGATNENSDLIRNLDPKAACGVKIFMGASTGQMLVDDPKILEAMFRDCPILIATHCEDTPTITENENKYREKYGENVPMSAHPLIRSEEACWKSSSFAVDLAKRFGTQLHVLHLTTARELALFTKGDLKGKHITAEACVHHLWFSEKEYETLGAQIKCNPAIKREADRTALVQAVKDDLIDIIATDHAPHTWDEKQGTYFQAPSGLPLVQHALQTALEFVHDGVFSLEHVVKKTAHAPAQRYQVKERGYLREGYWADLVCVDMKQPYDVTHNNLLYHCGWSPFEGKTFRSSIMNTWVNGVQVWKEGYVLGQALGKRLEFDR